MTEAEELELLELEREKSMAQPMSQPKQAQTLEQALPDLSQVNILDQIKSFGVNALQGATLNAAPYLGAFYGMPNQPYGDKVKGIKKSIDEITSKAPEAGTAGNISGSIATSALMPGASLPGKLKFLSPVVTDALQGLTSGALGSRKDDLDGVTEDALTSAGTQAGLGIALRPLSALLKKLPSRKDIAGSLDDFANMQANRAIGVNKPAMASMGERKANELGDFLLKNKVVTPLSSLDDMMASASNINKSSGEQIGSIFNQLDDMGAKFNPKDVIGASEAAPTIQNIRRFADYSAQRAPINKAKDSLYSLMNNPSLSEGWNYKKVLGDIIYGGKKFNNPRVNTEALDIYRQNLGNELVNKATETSTAKSMPDLGKALTDANKKYSLSNLAEDALGDKWASRYGNKGMFGLTNSIVGSAAATRGSSAGEGLSNFISTVTGKRALENYIPTTTATMSKAMSYTIGKDSPLNKLIDKAKITGNITKLLNNAPLPINHFILSQTDREYQAGDR